ncbi:MAG TPA: GNAT family N-acetyltransferase [Bacteroides sp.]|nr:GNAT family N-acetyltransferase [Bacteroides sp.]
MNTEKHGKQAGVIGLRSEVRTGDPAIVEEIVRSTGFFREDEVTVAVELVRERLDKGAESGYEFIFAQAGSQTVGYSCFGLIPCTLHSFDLYWIATHRDHMNRGIGRRLLEETESVIRILGGTGIYVETSSKPLYTPTRAFYEKNSYRVKARFEDFYDRGDDKIVYVKYLSPANQKV